MAGKRNQQPKSGSGKWTEALDPDEVQAALEDATVEIPEPRTMGWRPWQDYAPRPKRLGREELEQLARQMTAAVDRSPVRSGLGVRIRTQRGRFYVERGAGERAVRWGRITPVLENGPLLLECERGAKR